MTAQLKCFIFPDLLPWERESILPLLDPLSRRCNLETIEVRDSQRGVLRQAKASEKVWVIAKNWPQAVRFLGGQQTSASVFASVMGHTQTRRPLPLVFWERFKKSTPATVRLIAHSPLNFRFLKEMEAYPESQVSLLHLPFSETLASHFQKNARVRPEGARIGTFARFSSENNLNFFLNIAHYICQKKPQTRFRIFGSGELYAHLADMVVDLKLDEQVTIVESLSPHEIDALDLMLFAPIRNDHFLPLLIAAAARLPVLCSEVPGVEAYIEHGKTGFIYRTNETKPMAEKALELLDHTSVRRTLSDQFYKTISAKYAGERLAEQYWRVFFQPSSESAQPLPEAA